MYRGGHILELCGERLLMEHRHLLTHFLIVCFNLSRHKLLVRPLQECHLGRVTDALSVLTQESGAVHGNGCREERCVVCRGILRGKYLHIPHRHLILCECSRLVCTDHGHSSHRLTGMQFSHKVIANQHPAHVQSQTERHGHGQSFGHSHHDQRHRHHEILQDNLRHLEVVVTMPQFRMRKDMMRQEDDEGRYRQSKTDLVDHRAQTFQLDIQRCLHIRILSGTLRYLSDLCGIADSRNDHLSPTVHHHRRAHHTVRGIGGMGIVQRLFRMLIS